MEITRGKIHTAQKVVLYGPEGIGKSTFASRFPEPLFIDTEGSTRQLDVARLPKPTSWQFMMDEVREVIAHPELCRTLVIDTADWAEQLCTDAICARAKKTGIEDFGYGKGYVYLAEDFGRMLNLLEEVVGRGVHVLVTAHAKMRKFEQPDEMGAYDRWELKLSKNTAPMLKEWADMVLFANYRTFTVRTSDTDKSKVKAQGGKRVMFTTHHPCWDAKNRHGLAEELPFEYAQIASCISAPGQPEIPMPEFRHRAETPAQSPEFVPQANVQETPPMPPAQPAPVASAGTSQQLAMEIAASQTITAPEGFTDVRAPKSLPPELPEALRGLMENNHVTEAEIRLVVSEKGYFPLDMPVKDYPHDFVQGVLIGAWEQVFEMVKKERETPF